MQNATKTEPLSTQLILVLLAIGIVASAIASAIIPTFLFRHYLPTVWAVPAVLLWVPVMFVLVWFIFGWAEKIAKRIREKSAAGLGNLEISEPTGR